MIKHINLIIPELLPKFDPFTLKNVVIAASCLVLTLGGMSAYALWQKNQAAGRLASIEKSLLQLQQTIAESGKALSERRPSPTLAAETDQIRGNLHARAAAIRTLALHTAPTDQRSHLYSTVLGALGRQAMEGVWLTAIEVAGNDIEISGRMRDHSLLPMYLQKLNAEPTFQNFRFSALTMKGVKPASTLSNGNGQANAAEAPFIEFSLRTREHPLHTQKPGDARVNAQVSVDRKQGQLPSSLLNLLAEIEQLPLLPNKPTP